MILRLPACLAAVLAVAASGAAGSVPVLAGSDLLKPALVPAAADGGAARVILRLEGSRGALADLREGRADLAVAALQAGQAPPEGFRVLPIGYQVAVVAVPNANPLRQASFAQLGALFGEREVANIRRWNELIPGSEWENRTVALQALASPDSLGVDLFANVVLRNGQLKPTIGFLPDLKALLVRLRIDESSIALLPVLPQDRVGIHLLQVAASETDVAFAPTPENIHAGDYAVRLPFSVLWRPERSAELLPVLRWLLSDSVADSLDGAGFVAIPANARRQLVTELR